MALPSSVPAIQFTPAGLVIPAEVDILAGVQSDTNAAFGGGLNPALETPQGQLASSQTAIIADKNDEFARYVNQVDPQFSSGKFQDAIARIYFLTRKPAQATAVAVTLIGVAGTVVPVGTLAQDTSGNTYAATGDITIDLTGTGSGEFQNIITGPIPCAVNTLVQVYQAIPGWDAIDNAADGVLGQDVESRADFEFRRKNSVALNGVGTLGSIYANVFNVADVLDVYAIDNPSGSTVNNGPTNYPMAPHSLYVAVVGGLDLNIAEAIWRKKDVGCDYNGNTSVIVKDMAGYNYPQPTYTVKFQRPAALPVFFAVNLVNDPTLPANIITLVRQAIIAQFNGTLTGGRERIGASIFASRYYTSVSALGQNVAVISIFIGTGVSPTGATLAVGIDQSPTLDATHIAVNLV